MGRHVSLRYVGAHGSPRRVGVLDDHGCWLVGGRTGVAEGVNEAPGRLGVEQVQIRHGLTCMDDHGVPPPRGADHAVPSTDLMGILAVPEVLDTVQR